MTPFSIVLGCFYGEYFTYVKNKTDSREWGFGVFELPQVNTPEQGILRTVHVAAHHCTTINFVLDRIKLPLNTKLSYTCLELDFILRYPEYLKKTVFWIKGEVIDTKIVLKTIKKVKDNELSFDNLDMSTIK